MNIVRSSVLSILAKTPMMRTVQIADRLDMSIDETEGALRMCVLDGSIIEHEVDAPNNRKAMAYELSAQYMASHSLSLPARPSAAPAVVMAEQKASAPGQSTSAVGMTKVERAIAFVRKNGPSSSAQLHAELGLGEGVHVSSYLGSAVRTGRLARDGQTWSLPGPGAIAPVDIPKFSACASAPAAGQADTLQSLAPAKSELPSAVAHVPFRCALWSDGTFEIQRNGATLATLVEHEYRAIIEQLSRGVPA